MRTPFITLIIAAFLLNILGPLPVQANEFALPTPGVMIHLSPSFNPPILKGIKVNPDDPFKFEFILDRGDSLPPAGRAREGQEQLKQESTTLIKYFLASLTIPEKDLWVNLSPYEKDRIVPESFGKTEMGRDLLAEDYMLKQITASLMYPEDEVGKKFWKRIYEESAKKFGTTNIPVNTFNKVWIVPEKAKVYENAKAGTAYVIESKLKVMLEKDYLALEKNVKAPQVNYRATNELGTQITREIIIPELQKEINEGKNFAQLRQVYNSLILAAWYKKKIKDSILSQVYNDKNKIRGVNIDNPNEKEKIYQRYLQAFKKGAYNYIKEEQDPVSQQVISRKYFSGGASLYKVGDVIEETDSDVAMLNQSKKGLMLITLALTTLAPLNLSDQSLPPEPQKIKTPEEQTSVPAQAPKEQEWRWRKGTVGFIEMLRASPDQGKLLSNLIITDDTSEDDVLAKIQDKFKVTLGKESWEYLANNLPFVIYQMNAMSLRMGESDESFEKSIETYDKEFPRLDGNFLTSNDAFMAWMHFLLMIHKFDVHNPGRFEINMHYINEYFGPQQGEAVSPLDKAFQHWSSTHTGEEGQLLTMLSRLLELVDRFDVKFVEATRTLRHISGLMENESAEIKPEEMINTFLVVSQFPEEQQYCFFENMKISQNTSPRYYTSQYLLEEHDKFPEVFKLTGGMKYKQILENNPILASWLYQLSPTTMLLRGEIDDSFLSGFENTISSFDRYQVGELISIHDISDFNWKSKESPIRQIMGQPNAFLKALALREGSSAVTDQQQVDFRNAIYENVTTVEQMIAMLASKKEKSPYVDFELVVYQQKMNAIKEEKLRNLIEKYFQSGSSYLLNEIRSLRNEIDNPTEKWWENSTELHSLDGPITSLPIGVPDNINNASPTNSVDTSEQLTIQQKEIRDGLKQQLSQQIEAAKISHGVDTLSNVDIEDIAAKLLEQAVQLAPEQAQFIKDSLVKMVNGYEQGGSNLINSIGSSFDSNDQAMTGVSRKDFIKTVSLFGASILFNPSILLGQNLNNLSTSKIQPYLKYFLDQSNPQTGLSLSHFGDELASRKYGSESYDSSLRAIAEAGGNGIKIMNTFVKNTSQAVDENNPQTVDISYSPPNGVLNNIRIKNISEPNWWSKWEFGVRAGDNAWIGMAALQNYSKNKDENLLSFAKERADFLIKLQDTDGALRFGPQGQYHEGGDTSFLWKIKSTENNESALYFFDMLYVVTKDAQYKQLADRIYEWLVGKMYDNNKHIFMRGSNSLGGEWQRDGSSLFAADTTSWAPLERMLNDPRFGAMRLDRIKEFEKSIQATEQLTGVYQEGKLKGISFSHQSASQNVISIEWSSQFALRYLRMSQEYAALKNEAKQKEFNEKYQSLLAQIGSYFKQRDGSFVAPYAVYPTGEIAANVPTGHGWDTPNAYASVASIYYAFALAGFDPNILDRAMLGDQEVTKMTTFSTNNQLALSVKIMGDLLKDYDPSWIDDNLKDFISQVTSNRSIRRDDNVSSITFKPRKKYGAKIYKVINKYLTDEVSPQVKITAKIWVQLMIQLDWILQESIHNKGILLSFQYEIFRFSEFLSGKETNAHHVFTIYALLISFNKILEGELGAGASMFDEALNKRSELEGNFKVLLQMQKISNSLNKVKKYLMTRPEIRSPRYEKLIDDRIKEIQDKAMMNDFSQSNQITLSLRITDLLLQKYSSQSITIVLEEIIKEINQKKISDEEHINTVITGGEFSQKEGPGIYTLIKLEVKGSLSSHVIITVREWLEFLNIMQKTIDRADVNIKVSNPSQDPLYAMDEFLESARLSKKGIFDASNILMMYGSLITYREILNDLSKAKTDILFDSLLKQRGDIEEHLKRVLKGMKSQKFLEKIKNFIISNPHLRSNRYEALLDQRIKELNDQAALSKAVSFNLAQLLNDQASHTIVNMNGRRIVFILRHGESEEKRYGDTLESYAIDSFDLDDAQKRRVGHITFALHHDMDQQYASLTMDRNLILSQNSKDKLKDILKQFELNKTDLAFRAGWYGLWVRLIYRNHKRLNVQGMGRLLMVSAIAVAQQRGMKAFRVEATKNSKNFYIEQFGAQIYSFNSIVARYQLNIDLKKDFARPWLKGSLRELSMRKNLAVAPFNKGGIDLTSAHLDLQTQSGGGEIKFKIDPAMFKQLQDSSGFMPVIINVQPLKDLQLFLGINSPKTSDVSA